MIVEGKKRVIKKGKRCGNKREVHKSSDKVEKRNQ